MVNILFYLISTSIMLLTGWYLGWRLISPALISTAWKSAAWLALVFVILLPFFSYLASSRGWEKSGYILSWLGYAGLGLISFLIVFLLMRDVFFLFGQGGQKLVHIIRSPANTILSEDGILSNPERRRFLINATNLGIVAVSATLTGYGIFEARRKPAIRQLSIPIPALPDDLQGLRIVQISDIHAGLTIRRDWIETVVDEVNRLQPDLIAFTGDLADGSVPALSYDVEPLNRLQAAYGKFFITGNHEYYSGALDWVEKVRDLGFTVLNNEQHVTTKGSGRILLAGVTDISAAQFVPEHRSDPQKVLENPPPSDVTIFLAHQPRSLHQAARFGFDLMLSGHTHGGQFIPWNWFAALGQPFVKGLHRAQTGKGEGWVYVSVGTGYWGPPLRVNTRSEIGVFTLTRV